MTHDELLAKLDYHRCVYSPALMAVVKLHKPFQFESNPDEYKAVCQHCQMGIVGDEYPCETI